MRKALCHRLPQRVAIDAVVVMHHEIAMPCRLGPQGFGEGDRIGRSQPLGELAHAVGQRLESERKGDVGFELVAAPFGKSGSDVEGVEEVVEPPFDAFGFRHNETASARMPASRRASSDRIDTTSTGLSNSASRSISN